MAFGGGEDDDDGLRAGFEPPEDDAGEGPVFAGAVATDDGDFALVGGEVEHFELLGVGFAGVGEGVGDEGGGIVAVLGEGDGLRCGGVGVGGVAGRGAGRAGFARLGAVSAEDCGNETHR